MAIADDFSPIVHPLPRRRGPGALRPPERRQRMLLPGLAGLALVLAASSCTPVPAVDQITVSKPNMVFDDTDSFAFSSRLMPQSEPGSALSGSAPGGGCTACR